MAWGDAAKKREEALVAHFVDVLLPAAPTDTEDDR